MSTWTFLYEPSAEPTNAPTQYPTYAPLYVTCSSQGGAGCCSLCTSSPCHMTFDSSVTSIGIVIDDNHHHHHRHHHHQNHHHYHIQQQHQHPILLLLVIITLIRWFPRMSRSYIRYYP